jgi:soluble lytic murein transglycosylase-like protein
MALKIAILLIMSSPEFYLSKSRINTLNKNADYIITMSHKYDFDPLLIFALIYTESGWKKTAVSSAGACGLTQVIPKYTGNGRGGKSPAGVKRLTCDQLKDPRVSIKAGIKTLHWWRAYYGEDISRALCGYNAGFRCSGKKPSSGGMRYSRKVLSYKDDFNIKYKNMLAE